MKIYSRTDILYRDIDKNGFYLGLEAGEHAGYWYCANIEQKDNESMIR